jgi:GntR family histidine utilization transcriptional repressor
MSLSRRQDEGPLYRNDGPLYRQVKDYIVGRILAGDWPETARVPSENALTGELGVSRMTVHRALRELTAEGWLTRLQGAGTFVAEHKPQSALLEIRNIRQEIAERGHVHRCAVARLARAAATAGVAEALQVAPGSEVFHAVLLHLEDEVPVQVEDRHVNPAFAPGYIEQDFTRVTSYEYLNELGPMHAAEHVIEAVQPNRLYRGLLAVPADEPCLLLTRRTWSHDLVVSRARFVYPGSRYRLAGRQDYSNPGAEA